MLVLGRCERGGKSPVGRWPVSLACDLHNCFLLMMLLFYILLLNLQILESGTLLLKIIFIENFIHVYIVF